MGSEGFTLNEAARLLGAEWEEEPQFVARAFWRDFVAGEFDPPDGEDEAFDLEHLLDANIETPEIPEPARRLMHEHPVRLNVVYKTGT